MKNEPILFIFSPIAAISIMNRDYIYHGNRAVYGLLARYSYSLLAHQIHNPQRNSLASDHRILLSKVLFLHDMAVKN